MISLADHDLLLAYVKARLSAKAVLALEARLKSDQSLALAYLALVREETVFLRWAAPWRPRFNHFRATGRLEKTPYHSYCQG